MCEPKPDRYSILARDIFNQNYALFIAAADGATFQPNPVSHVNSDHLVYFKFVGRIVGKAIADGQALDAHFTQSFYKVPAPRFCCGSRPRAGVGGGGGGYTYDPVVARCIDRLTSHPNDDGIGWMCRVFADQTSFLVLRDIAGSQSLPVLRCYWSATNRFHMGRCVGHPEQPSVSRSTGVL